MITIINRGYVASVTHSSSSLLGLEPGEKVQERGFKGTLSTVHFNSTNSIELVYVDDEWYYDGSNIIIEPNCFRRSTGVLINRKEAKEDPELTKYVGYYKSTPEQRWLLKTRGAKEVYWGGGVTPVHAADVALYAAFSMNGCRYYEIPVKVAKRLGWDVD